MTKTLAEALEETLGFMDRALSKIEQREGAEAEAHNLRAYLLNALDLVERDPGIDAAADDLDVSVSAFVKVRADGRPLRSAQLRMPREAFNKFRERLVLARPSENARRMGLT